MADPVQVKRATSTHEVCEFLEWHRGCKIIGMVKDNGVYEIFWSF